MKAASGTHRPMELVWVRPQTSALAALTAEDALDDAAWLQALSDAPFVAHLLRFARPSLQSSDELSPQLVEQPALALQAASFLKHAPQTPPPLPTEVEQTFALARTIARQLAPPSLQRWAVALTQLPALGWHALILAPSQDEPLYVALQLLNRWRVPSWVSAIVAGLPLLARDAEQLGAPSELFRYVQTSLATAERHATRLNLTTSTATTTNEVELSSVPAQPTWNSHISDDLLVRLLRQSARASRANAAIWLQEAEQREQKLIKTLAQVRAEFAEQVQKARLSGLAEFAAGASHEINNPLAVISGHAQLLLHGEAEPGRQRQLETIIRQTRRIDDLLHGTRQFARPSRPKAVRFFIHEWQHEIWTCVQPELESKQLQWHCHLPDSIAAFGDPVQLRQALIQLVRNAVDAAPNGGEVSVVAELGEQITIVVEDSGPGPAQAQIPHLFDPFYSGRMAGRGRGLGLSIAWRLASINGGSVQYQPLAAHPSRFVLTIPRSAAQPLPTPKVAERRSA